MAISTDPVSSASRRSKPRKSKMHTPNWGKIIPIKVTTHGLQLGIHFIGRTFLYMWIRVTASEIVPIAITPTITNKQYMIPYPESPWSTFCDRTIEVTHRVTSSNKPKCVVISCFSIL